MEPTNFEIEGRKYQALPLRGFDVLELDRIVSGLTLRSIGVATLANFGAAKDRMVLVAGFARGIAEMPVDHYRRLVDLTFQGCVAVGAGPKGADMALAGDAIGDHFAGHLIDMYQAMYNIWEGNKLSPFDYLSRIGNKTPEMPISN